MYLSVCGRESQFLAAVSLVFVFFFYFLHLQFVLFLWLFLLNPSLSHPFLPGTGFFFFNQHQEACRGGKAVHVWKRSVMIGLFLLARESERERDTDVYICWCRFDWTYKHTVLVVCVCSLLSARPALTHSCLKSIKHLCSDRNRSIDWLNWCMGAFAVGVRQRDCLCTSVLLSFLRPSLFAVVKPICYSEISEFWPSLPL